MSSLLHSHSPFRIFAISGFISLATLVGVFYYLGPQAAFITLVLIAIEITFSFENAVINAKTLATMSSFWRNMFMTVGILIAVFGMRVVFPVVLVMLTANLSWSNVINLALNNPTGYADALQSAHHSIAAFGGTFLLMLCLHFFFDKERTIYWIKTIEKRLQNIGAWWLHAVVCAIVVVVLSILPGNEHQLDTLIAGGLGIATYLAIHGLTVLFTKNHNKTKAVMKTGLAGFTAFLYLEVLDASFSFDGVIGAFAVTQDVILIALGLGVGALWVRSLTLFMVRRKTLHAYKYLEHGAHYTIGVLAVVLLIGLFYDIPEIVAGFAGVTLIGASIASSIRLRRTEAV